MKERIPDLPDFAAIDFEAANEHLTSACSIGVVIVRNREISDTFYTLLKPIPNFYRFWNTKIHGLTEKDTHDAPLFSEAWKTIGLMIDGLPILAHGKSFEERTLKRLLNFFHIPHDEFVFHCTHHWSEKLLPDISDHKLQTVAASCGYDLTKHHNALADAEACAYIGIGLFRGGFVSQKKTDSDSRQ